MSARGKARRRAVEILFEAEQRSEDAREVMERRRMHSDSQVSPYAEELVLGVTMRRGELDEYLETYSQGWTLERMPAVDRNVLRVGAGSCCSTTTSRTGSPWPRP